MNVKVEDYVEAARAMGNPRWRIAVFHILPNIMPALLVQATLSIAAAIIAEAALSFLGLGQQPPAPSWGSMLNAPSASSPTHHGWRCGRDWQSSWWCCRSPDRRRPARRARSEGAVGGRERYALSRACGESWGGGSLKEIADAAPTRLALLGTLPASGRGKKSNTLDHRLPHSLGNPSRTRDRSPGPCEMPGQAGTHRAAADQFVGRHGMEIVHGVGLHR